MKKPIDQWLKIQGLKQTKTRKPILYWAAYYGNAEVDVNNSIALLRYKWKDYKGMTFKAIR